MGRGLRWQRAPVVVRASHCSSKSIQWPYDPTTLTTSGHSRQHTEVFRLAEAGKCSLNGSDLALQAKYGGDRLKQSDWL
jgi:hypothetical protein